jgi:hypothetical protein
VGNIDVSVIPLSPSSCRNPANKAAWLKHGKGRGADQGMVGESFGFQQNSRAIVQCSAGRTLTAPIGGVARFAQALR